MIHVNNVGKTKARMLNNLGDTMIILDHNY